SGWIVVGLSAASLGSASTVDPTKLAPAKPLQLAQASPYNYAQPAPQGSAWDTYKLRLAILARQQGVRQSTIDANVPGLDLNQRVIELERTEPVARSSGGIVGTLAPYLRDHVTPSLISRGRRNYSDNCSALRTIDARYGVDPAVLMAIWGEETSYGTV